MKNGAVLLRSALAALFFSLIGQPADAAIVTHRYFATSAQAKSWCDSYAGPKILVYYPSCGGTCGALDANTWWATTAEICGAPPGNEDVYAHFNISCAEGQTVNELTGACETPPPVGDCALEKGKRVAIAGGGSCFKVHQGLNCNGGECTNAYALCKAELVITVGGEGSTIGDHRLTGETCTTQDNPTEPLPPNTTTGNSTLPSEQCLTSGGTTACVDTSSRPNCGTVNGESVCVDSVPSGNCAFIPGGNWVCDSSAATPPKPAASPVVTISGRGSNGKPTTVQVYPKGAEGGDSGSTYGAGAPGQDGASCGGEGQPKCKIDEEGTPTFEEGSLDAAEGALDGALTEAEGAAGEGPYGDGSGVAAAARGGVAGALPSPGDCGPITWALPFGNEVVIDLYDKCAPFRAGMAWVLGLVTAWFLLHLAFRAPS